MAAPIVETLRGCRVFRFHDTRPSSGISFLEPELAPDRVRLRWQQESSDTVLPADALSDGTLRFICLTTLLGQPELPGLIILDEPKLGLHPFAIVQLAAMLRAVSRESHLLHRRRTPPSSRYWVVVVGRRVLY
jgi:predicted ATPase